MIARECAACRGTGDNGRGDACACCAGRGEIRSAQLPADAGDSLLPLDTDAVLAPCDSTEALREEATLRADPDFAAICDARRDAWLALSIELDADTAADAALPWGPQWCADDALDAAAVAL